MANNPFITDAQATQKIQEAFHELEGQIDGIASGYRGTITIADTPTEDGIYTPTEEGTYTNAGGLEYDPTEGMTYFIRTDGVWTKNVTPINLTPTGVVEEGNTQAVSGGEVYNKTLLISDVKKDNLFDPQSVVYGKYISGTGTISDNANGSYGVISLIQGQSSLFMSIPYNGGNHRRVIFTDDSDEIVGTVINMELATDYSVLIPEGATKYKFTIDPPGNDGAIDLSLVESNYGNSLNPLNNYIKEIKGHKITASNIDTTDQVKEVINSLSNIQEESIIYNLVNPDDVHANSTYNKGSYIESSLYHATGEIDIVYGNTYYANSKSGISNPIRTWREISANGTQVHSQIAGSYSQITLNNSQAVKIVVVFYNTTSPNGLCLSLENKGYEDYEGYKKTFVTNEEQKLLLDNSVVTQKNLNDIINNLPELNTRVTLQNSDKILYTGSSSIESFYSPDRKSWVNKLQDFLEIQLVPYGWSGNSASQIASKLINDTPTQTANGVKPSEVNPTYVFVGQTLNMSDPLAEDYDTTFVEDNELLLSTAISRTGAKPILGTAYRTEVRPWIENSLKRIADKWGADFMPFGTYHRSFIRTNKYSGFYGSGHPGIRVSDAYTLPLLSYINQLPRPKQGILLFEARDQDEAVSNLGYKDNYERAVKFRTIQVGEMSLASGDQDMYDRLDESYSINKTNTSEYMKLFKKQSVSFGKTLLIEAIIPKVRTSNVTISLESDGIDEYYLYNSSTQEFDLVESLDIVDRKYIEFDKIKLLCVGDEIVLSDVYVDVVGGVVKPEQNYNRVIPPQAGEVIIESVGFDDNTVLNWDLGGNDVYNITEKYDDNKFNDMPNYLGESKDLIVLTDTLKKTITLTDVKTFGYRTMRIWTCSRLNPKIYNPDAEFSGEESPYTDVNWCDQNKYDYDDLYIIVKYTIGASQNLTKSINVQKVGLFWNIGYVDVLLATTRDGNYEIQLYRGTSHNDYQMEICDVSVEIL